MMLQPGPAETTLGHLRLVLPLRGSLPMRKPVSSFGGRSVGKTVSRLLFGMSEALRTFKKGTETKHKLGRDDLHIKILNQGLFISCSLMMN